MLVLLAIEITLNPPIGFGRITAVPPPSTMRWIRASLSKALSAITAWALTPLNNVCACVTSWTCPPVTSQRAKLPNPSTSA